MQAPPSRTASGEQLFSSLPPSLSTASGSPPPPQTSVASFLENRWSDPGEQLAVAGDGVAEGIGLAHDAGNLLGAIRLYCDLLALPGVLGSEHRHYADELSRLTARSGSLIARLLRPDKLAAEGVNTERIRPAEVVMECRSMLGTIGGPGSPRIAVDAGANGEIAVPREALERILVNLTKNAAEATRTEDGTDEERGTVILRVRSVGGWGPERAEGIALSVEDRGRGMEEGVLRAVLSGETNGASSGERGRQGRGVGLRVVRELAARTGGELRMQSRLGYGTTVEIVWAALPGDRTESG